MKLKATLFVILSTLALNVSAQGNSKYSQSAEDYAKARYGDRKMEVLHDHKIGPQVPKGSNVVGGSPDLPKNHNFNRLESAMGGH